MEKAAIIVPYRDRPGHLNRFVAHMVPMLPRIGGGAVLCVIEQTPGKPFNRGKLLNVGALAVDAEYYIFHDVDMLPQQADYSAPKCPTHIATRCSQFRYKMPFPDYFGGVTLFTRDDFYKVNGFSNRFWSWGAEDCELRETVKAAGLKIERRQCVFQSLHHAPSDRSLYSENLKIYKAGRQPDDGLTHCSYTINETYKGHEWCKISVHI